MVTSDYNFKAPPIGWPFNFPPNVFSSKMWTNRKYVTLAYKRPPALKPRFLSNYFFVFTFSSVLKLLFLSMLMEPFFFLS